jgi:hypothetical protein
LSDAPGKAREARRPTRGSPKERVKDVEHKDIYHSLPNSKTMDIEAEVMEMKQMFIDISRRIDDVLDESMTEELMKLSEKSFMELYEDEPDLYSVADLKVRYK